MFDLFVCILIIGSVWCLSVVVSPALSKIWGTTSTQLEQYQLKKAANTTRVLDDMFMDVKPAWVTRAYQLAPLISAVAIFLLFRNLLVALLCGVAAMVVPDVVARIAKAKRKIQFQGQLVDSLFMLSSSLRAGLSLTQAFETLESEMTPPASQEFGLMMKAHRVGLSFEESLQGLNRRMPSEEMNLFCTSVLLARSTGGDLTKIIAQLITTIRERRKLDEKVKSLTLQGKLQAYAMSALPIFFAAFVNTFNPGYFQPLLKDPMGPTLIATAAGLWIVGMILMFRMSKVEF